MFIVNAAKLQRLARLLQEVQRLVEEAGGEPGRIEEALGRTAEQVGMDLEVARLMDADTVERLAAPGTDPDPGRAWVVAELLYLDGIRRRAADRDAPDPEARDRLTKARRLFEIVEAASPRLPDEAAPPTDRLREIERLLGTP